MNKTVASSAPYICGKRYLYTSKRGIHNPNVAVSAWDNEQNCNCTWNLTIGSNLISKEKENTLDSDSSNGFKLASQARNCNFLNFFRDDTENFTKITSELSENIRPSVSGKSGEAKAMKEIISKKEYKKFEGFNYRRKDNETRVLSGNVKRVMSWFKLKNYLNIIFEVTAILVDLREGRLPREKFLVLRDEKTGPSLLVKFYEMDRKLPHFDIGTVVKCIGRLIHRNSLHAFKVEISSEQENIQSQRLFLMSNLVADEFKTLYLKKEKNQKNRMVLENRN